MKVLPESSTYYLEDNAFVISRLAFNKDDRSPIYAHMHRAYEIFMLIEGCASYTVEGNLYDLCPMDIIITNMRELHAPIYNSCFYKRINMIIKPRFLSPFISPDFSPFSFFDLRKPGFCNKFDHTVVTSQGIAGLIEKIEKVLSENAPESGAMAKVYLMELLYKMSKFSALAVRTSTLSNDAAHILEYINNNIAEDLSYKKLSDIFHINKDYLYRYFRNNSGFALGDYIMNKRILKAKELLLDGVSPTLIPEAVGFNDYSTFYRAFIKLVKMTPTDYKNPEKRHKFNNPIME